ncbi:DNA polymerase epsilon subunit 3-like [Pseudophryne corroboree]|uniref:DNA polymerase epsilon subunit 3-like n=1 Tax=Pseudophryne corroboree TaxID=495146 RepID=UPI00308167F6
MPSSHASLRKLEGEEEDAECDGCVGGCGGDGVSAVPDATERVPGGRDQNGDKEATELRKKDKEKKPGCDDPDRSREEEVEEEEEKMDEDEAVEQEEVMN